MDVWLPDKTIRGKHNDGITSHSVINPFCATANVTAFAPFLFLHAKEYAPVFVAHRKNRQEKATWPMAHQLPKISRVDYRVHREHPFTLENNIYISTDLPNHQLLRQYNANLL